MLNYATATKSEIEAYRARMDKAFAVADPSCGGKVPGVSWRDEIRFSGTVAVVDRLFALEGTSLEEGK